MQKGPHLSQDDISNAVDKCLQNAEELLEEARLLLEKGRNARAFSLTVLAQEELGKLAYLSTARAYVGVSDRKEWAPFWRGFMNHASKYVETVGLDYRYVLGEDIKYAIEDVGDIYDKKSSKRLPRKKVPRAADDLKQLGFYVDYRQSTQGDGFTMPNTLFKNTSKFIKRYISFTAKKLHILRSAWKVATKERKRKQTDFLVSQLNSYKRMRSYIAKMERALTKNSGPCVRPKSLKN